MNILEIILKHSLFILRLISLLLNISLINLFKTAFSWITPCKNIRTDQDLCLHGFYVMFYVILRAPAPPYTAILLCDGILLNRPVILNYTVPKPYSWLLNTFDKKAKLLVRGGDVGGLNNMRHLLSKRQTAQPLKRFSFSSWIQFLLI